MFELLTAFCFLGTYATGVVVTFFIAMFALRGQEFSNEHTQGMHYTNEGAAEAAVVYAVAWPATILMLGYGQFIKTVSNI